MHKEPLPDGWESTSAGAIPWSPTGAVVEKVTILPDAEAALEWDLLLPKFSVPAFYQGYRWGKYRSGSGWRPLRCLLSSRDDLWGMAQCLVKEHRACRVVVVWIPGGPFLMPGHWSRFLNAVRSLFEGWSLYIRIDPPDRQSEVAADQLRRSGWKPAASKMNSGQTILVPLEEDENVRRSRLTGNWRHNLTRGERLGLVVDRWQGDRAAEQLFRLYRDMVFFKRIGLAMGQEELHRLLQVFDKHFVLVTARNSRGEVMAARGGGMVGRHAYDLFAATSEKGRRSYASYVTLWRLLEELKREGVTTYDLGGIDPVRAQGVYHFKRGVGGQLVQRLGEWEWSQSKAVGWAVNAWVRARAAFRA